MSDPRSKHWLADDPGFIDSLGDLDRGLVSGDQPIQHEPAAEMTPIAAVPPPVVASEPEDAPRTASSSPGPAAVRAARPINAARAMDPSRLLDTAPPPARIAAAPAILSPPARPAQTPGPPPPVAPEILSGMNDDSLPPFLFTQSTPGDPQRRRPLLDLFPSTALEPEAPMPAPGAAVAPQREPSPPLREAPPLAAVIELPLIQAAAGDRDLEWPGPDRPRRLASLLMVMVFALLVIAGAAGAVWVFRDAVDRTIQQWESVPLAPGGPIQRLPVPLAPIPPPPGSLDAP